MGATGATAVEGRELNELDDDVLAKTAAEDFEAFAELYRRYLCRIYRHIRAQVPSDATAEDLTAQVFFRALKSAATFRGDSSYAAWIFRIAHNTVVTWRGGKHRATVPVEYIPEEQDPLPGPASQVVIGERRNLVWRTITELPPAQREVVTLRYVEDLSIEEVAGITSKSNGAVRILLHRARNSLRRALGEAEGR